MAASKPKGKKNAKVGRPLTVLTEAQWKTVEAMAKDMCSQQEIADYLGIGVRTLAAAHLRERFEKVTRMAQAATRWRVRRNQVTKALKGHPVGTIWWGKQHLGQKDRPDEQDERGRELEVVIGAEQRLLELLDRLSKNREAGA